jgi:hypothetical protein
MSSVAAALAFIADGEAFAAAAATADRKGLDGTGEVVTHPARTTAVATAIDERPVRTNLRANSKRDLAGLKQEGRTCSSRLLTSRAICEVNSLGKPMPHDPVSENVNSTLLSIFCYR